MHLNFLSLEFCAPPAYLWSFKSGVKMSWSRSLNRTPLTSLTLYLEKINALDTGESLTVHETKLLLEAMIEEII